MNGTVFLENRSGSADSGGDANGVWLRAMKVGVLGVTASEKEPRQMMRTLFVGCLALVAVLGLWIMRPESADTSGEIGGSRSTTVMPVVAPSENGEGPAERPTRVTHPGEASITRSAVSDVDGAGAGDRRDVLWVQVHTEANQADRSTTPVPRIQIEVGLDIPGRIGVTKLATVTTDDRGEVLFSFPRPSISASPEKNPRVWATIVEPGYQRRTTTASVKQADDPATPILLRVVPRPGGTVRGVLLDSLGRPATGYVVGHRPGVDGEWSIGGMDEVHLGAGFAMHIREGGPWRLTASDHTLSQRSPLAIGTAATGTMEFDLASPPTDLRLLLVGPGVVCGRVVDDRGQPAAGLDLNVLTAPTGRFVLEARLPGGRTASKEVEIVPEQTIRVELDFGSE